MVACRHEIEAEHFGAIEEPTELDAPVALDARVRRLARGIGVDVRGDHSPREVVGEVEDVVGDAELRGDPSRVLDVGDAATPGVAVAAPQLERDARDVEAAFEEQRGRDRRVDATAHGYEHARSGHRAPVATRIFSTTSGTTSRATVTSSSVDA
jgi:hypothetical protein